MTSSRPYLIRALYEWILDNELTPYILVNSDTPGVEIPEGYAKDGNIVLNLSQISTTYLVMDNSKVSFTAKFKGVKFDVVIPIPAIAAMYCKENGKGMVFDYEPEFSEPKQKHPKQKHTEESKRPSGRPQLKVVK